LPRPSQKQMEIVDLVSLSWLHTTGNQASGAKRLFFCVPGVKWIHTASFCILLGVLSIGAAWGQNYTISTFAGNAATGAGFSGDGGAASAAVLNGPSGVAVNAAGNLYIVDTENERIRVVQNGIIATVVGNGGFGYAGDGGSPLGAQLNNPTNVAFDASGNLYIADTDNSVIRMVSTAGVITTVAGIVCSQTQTTFCGPGYLGDGEQATVAQLNVPLGVAVDSAGNLYISDTANNVLREVNTSGIISTVATNLRLQHPAGLAIDGAGNLYIADTNNNRIMKLAPTGAIALVAGNNVAGYSGDGGPANKAQLSFPTGVAVDGAGNIYIADKTNSRIRKITADGVIHTIAGVGQAVFYGDGGPAIDAGLSFPSSVAVDKAGNVYVADTGNNVVRLLQIPAPAISASGIVNAASFAAATSPGALASIFGTNFGAVIASASSVPFPTTLGVVSVSVGGRPAPVFYISPTQINFQIPWETQVGNAGVTVTVNNVTSSAGTVAVKSAAPGLFTQGDGDAIVQNSDYSLNTSSNPASAGSAIIAYLTGSGPVNQSVADGAVSPSSPLVQATSPVSATIGTQTAQVLFAGLAPGLVGVFQVNVAVPAGTATGSYPLTITVGTQASNSATINVKQ
jgi:uncharacterized protein (TIGR03437 family)